MSDTLKVLARGELSGSLASLYEVPSDVVTIVKSITLCNTHASARTVTLDIEGVAVVSEHSIDGKDTLVIPLTLVMEAEDVLSGVASAAGDVDYYISGIEVA